MNPSSDIRSSMPHSVVIEADRQHIIYLLNGLYCQVLHSDGQIGCGVENCDQEPRCVREVGKPVESGDRLTTAVCCLSVITEGIDYLQLGIDDRHWWDYPEHQPLVVATVSPSLLCTGFQDVAVHTTPGLQDTVFHKTLVSTQPIK